MAITLGAKVCIGHSRTATSLGLAQPSADPKGNAMTDTEDNLALVNAACCWE